MGGESVALRGTDSLGYDPRSRMNLRGRLYFAYIGLRGSAIPRYYRQVLGEDAQWPASEGRSLRLARLLEHCRERVPHYAASLRELPHPVLDPLGVLQRMPILTKRIIRQELEALKSADLQARRWRFNTSGGSTGEPARFIQDADFESWSGAISLAYSRWAGHEVGEPEVRLWGSEREVLQGTQGWGVRAANALTRTTFLNAFRMTREGMREFSRALRRVRPKLVLAYAQALFELAGFLEAEGLEVPAAGAVITSAGTLHEFMRARIARVFQCPVYNRYGSREVGLIAAERSGIEGLWVAPWNVIVEVVDEAGHPVPPGVEGEILVTSLTNFAMPLVRYRIGDRGVLAPGEVRGGQVLARVLGRNVDAFRRRDGTLVDGEFFTHLLYFRDWVEKFQFIQTDYEQVVLRLVSREPDHRRLQPELDDIEAQARIALGRGTALTVEWVDEIPPTPSGKYRYTISEVAEPKLG
jgi:phenylacetate-CoA ligase